MEQQLLTPRTSSGVEQVEHMRRRARARETLNLGAAETFGTIETEPVPQGFRWLIDWLTVFGATASSAFINTVGPDSWVGPADGYTTLRLALNAGDRLVVEVTAAAAASVGLHVGYRLVEVEERAWPQAAPVNVVEMLGQRAPGPELVALAEPADG